MGSEERCSFCGRLKSEVKHMIQGAKQGAYICDKCAVVCKQILATALKKENEEKVAQKTATVTPMFPPDEPPKGA